MPTAQPAATKKKKDKPLVKTPIMGTDWIRVLTTEGNTFYSNKATKQSSWTVPDEIQEEVASLEREEEETRLKEEQAKAEVEQRKREEETAMEVERIKNEVQEAVGKRKADELVKETTTSKKARIEDKVDEEEESEEEEEWQREAAAQLAAEAAEHERLQEEERQREEEEARKAEEDLKAKQRALNIPDQVDLSLDEAKALFKVSLHAVSL